MQGSFGNVDARAQMYMPCEEERAQCMYNSEVLASSLKTVVRNVSLSPRMRRSQQTLGWSAAVVLVGAGEQ
jgi:hypothetical protein